MPQRVTVGLAGATGYLGQELLRLLHGHPSVDIQVLTSTSHAGKKVGNALPQFRTVIEHTFEPLRVEAFAHVDAVILAAPHGVALELTPALLAQGNRVIDLSGDHRLVAEAAAAHYGKAPSPEVARDVVYGLPELNRSRIRHAKIVANPGCYPTASVLAARPLIEIGIVQPRVIVDALSGVSGAGRETSPDLHFPEMHATARAYKVGTHRHEPEIAQGLGDCAVRFTPHVVPFNRGILATVHLFSEGPALAQEELMDLYAKYYVDAPFVRVVPHEPEPKHVRGTNFCDVRPHSLADGYVITSAIDNLVKGGSGQAVQNLNLMFDLPEHTGLPVTGGGV